MVKRMLCDVDPLISMSELHKMSTELWQTKVQFLDRKTSLE